MNKKTITALTILAVILVAGIVFALSRLYSTPDKKANPLQTERFIENHELIEAVPSDAAIVFCVKDFGRACEYLGDSSAVFGKLASGKFDRIACGSFPSLKRAPAVISVHYSKDMPPLLVVKTPLAADDSTANDALRLRAEADSAGLLSRVHGGDLILISSSETIINSAIRHIGEGHSVLEASGFGEIAAIAPGSDVIFLSNAYTDNIMETFAARRFRPRATFIKELAGWTAFSISRHTGNEVSMTGNLLYGSDPAYFLNVLRHAGTGPVSVAEAVPSTVDFIIDLPIGNISAYLKAYRNYLDAKAKLDKYEYTLSKQGKGGGLNAEDWAKSLDIGEVAIVNVHLSDKLRQLLLLRAGNKRAAALLEDFSPYAGFAKTLFGDIFTAEDESACSVTEGWIVAGAADAVKEYSNSLGETLSDRMKANGLSDRIPLKGCGFWMYHSLSEDPTLIDASFTPLMAGGLREVIKGASFVPVTLAAMRAGEKMTLEFNLTRTNAAWTPKSVASPDRDTAVVVPKGPFPVRNSATGKTNTLYQNSHLSICLRDENGKDLWGIPFKEPILGYVREIDYYNNGKLQYLFAAGSKLYLLDRLGRFVGGFPVDLGKKIAVGPEVYDFTGAKGYTAIVLHKDNTIGMYNLHGQPSPSWKGITADETIKGLPELLEGGGKRYWVVRTSRQSMVFPFGGGDPLVKGEGGKMIRPDSGITINQKGAIEAKCHDGKERTFKLGNEK